MKRDCAVLIVTPLTVLVFTFLFLSGPSANILLMIFLASASFLSLFMSTTAGGWFCVGFIWSA